MGKREVVQELADKMTYMLSSMVYAEAVRVYDDLAKLVHDEKRIAQIVLKPEIKVFMDTDKCIDLNANIAWKYELKRTGRTESIHIDPDQLTFGFTGGDRGLMQDVQGL